MTPGQVNWTMSFEVSPIYLTGGIAGNVPGGTVPLLNYLGAGLPSILSVGSEDNVDNYFARFTPVSGARLESNAIGEYPFANQSVAGNAIVTQPLTLSLLMRCPRRQPGDYTNFQAIMTSLKSTLDQHIIAGGLFTVATPAFLYTNCVLVGLTNADAGETRQGQYQWQWDFRKPLISTAEAVQSYNNLMAKMGSQTQFNPDATADPWSTQGNTVGNPASGASPSVTPSAQTNPSNGFSPAPVPQDSANFDVGFSGTPQSISAVQNPTVSEAVVTPATLGIPVTGAP